MKTHMKTCTKLAHRFTDATKVFHLLFVHGKIKMWKLCLSFRHWVHGPGWHGAPLRRPWYGVALCRHPTRIQRHSCVDIGAVEVLSWSTAVQWVLTCVSCRPHFRQSFWKMAPLAGGRRWAPSGEARGLTRRRWRYLAVGSSYATPP